MAYAVLGARPNSHPFQERKVTLKEPVKIGRAVAKCKSAASNLIFDCKVLSRSHAVIWYENGKFFIQDTKSSNGTYVNNVQVGRGTDDTESVEIRSGDVLQFGVDVTENSKKVTHGCIIATVTLVHADGTEAFGEPEKITGRVLPYVSSERNLKAQELWQLSKYIQDALNREQLLEQKLATMQRMIADSSTSSDEAYQAFVKEDELLSRLDILENELDVITKDMPEEDCRKLLINFQEEKETYEIKAKQTIQRLIEEKSEALQKLADVQRSLSYSEDECSHLKSVLEKSEEDIKDLMERNEQLTEDMQRNRQKIEDMGSSQKIFENKITEEKRRLKSEVEEAEKRASTLAVQVESLQAECDFTKEQLAAIKDKYEKCQADIAAHSEGYESSLPAPSSLPTAEHANLIQDLRDSLYGMRNLIRIMTTSTSCEGVKDNIFTGEIKAALDHYVCVHCLSVLIQLGTFKDQHCIGTPLGYLKRYLSESEACAEKDIDQEANQDLTASLGFCSQYSKQVNDELKAATELFAKWKGSEEHSLIEQLETAQSEVCQVREQINEVNENLIAEQATSRRYKDLAAEFEAILGREESRRKQLMASVDVMHSRLQELQARMQEKEKYPTDSKLIFEVFSQDDAIKEKMPLVMDEVQNTESEMISSEIQSKESVNDGEDKHTVNTENTDDSVPAEDITGDHKRKDSLGTQLKRTTDKKNQLFYILFALMVVIVAIGAAFMLDVIDISMGASPIYDKSTWRDIYEHLF